MDYKIVEMTGISLNYKHEKEEFIKSFQNEVNQLLNDGYVPAGGISVSIWYDPSAMHFAQALIKEK